MEPIVASGDENRFFSGQHRSDIVHLKPEAVSPPAVRFVWNATSVFTLISTSHLAKTPG